MNGKQLKHKCEYRELQRQYNDSSTNLQFYCIHCLKIVSMLFYSYDKVIKNPEVEEKT